MKNRINIYIITILFLLVATHFNWFNISSRIFSWDFHYVFQDYLDSFFPFGMGTWLWAIGFGSYNIQPYMNGIFALWWLIGNYDIALKVSILLPILGLQAIGMSLLLKKLFKEDSLNFPIFVSVLYFIFNTYFLYTSFSHLMILFSVSILPLLLYWYLRLIEEQNNINIIVFGLVYTFSCIYEVRITLINTIILLIVSTFYHKEFFQFLKNYKKLLLLILLILWLNFYWINALFVWNFNEAASKVIFRWVFWDQFTNIFYAITAYKPYWDVGWNSRDFILFEIPILTFLYITTLISNAFFQRQKKLIILSFVFVALWAFLLKQDADPFSWTYTWLYNNLPGFSIFRESSKFSIFVILGYSIGFTLFLYNIRSNFPLRTYKWVSALLIFTILYPALPLFLQKWTYT